MQAEDVCDVGVVGAGTMGAGIAQVFAQNGYAVRWYNRSAAGLQRGLERIRDNQGPLIRQGILTQDQAQAAMARLHPTEALADLAGVQLVSESIAENLTAKQALFRELDQLCGDATIFTTNTSGLSISRIAEAVSRPEFFAGLHCANPAHIIPAVEIIKGKETSDATCEVLIALAHRLGKQPVLVQRDLPGFIATGCNLPFCGKPCISSKQAWRRPPTWMRPSDTVSGCAGRCSAPCRLPTLAVLTSLKPSQATSSGI